MARVQKFEKVDGRPLFLKRLRKPDTAAAYLASVLRDGDKNEIQLALSDIAEANK
jgi:DNA-binding phage protein